MKIGILGAGQLASMLHDASASLGLDVFLYDGDQKNLERLREFLSKVNLVAFENEFVDCDLLERAAVGLRLKFLPGLNVIRAFQDKLTQKEMLIRLSIPTSPYVVIEESTKALPFGGHCVLKWSRMGYDGKGVMMLDETHSIDEPGVLEFCQRAKAAGGRVYAERRIDFTKELAIVAVRSAAGEFVTYPLVVSEQKGGICNRVMGPATNLGVAQSLEEEARSYAKQLANEVNMVGCFALEFFLSADGELLVNEIAPRVHNSGHFSMDACESSQFENHLRALAGMSLGSTRSTGFFAMLNLLGPEGIRRASKELELPRPQDPVQLHWYGKTEIRPGRKLGHVNAVAQSAGERDKILKALDDYHQQWVAALKGE